MSTLSAPISTAGLTPAEVEKASCYLAETAAALQDAAAGLTTAQWQFKPAPGRWSIAETLEHVVIVEALIHGNIHRMPEAPAPPADWNQAQIDESIPINVPNRTNRFVAPERICPSGQLCGPELLQKFLDTRNATRQLLSAAALRGHVVPHPVAGAWDGYQWLLAAAAHSARHTLQILEVKADPGFPRGN